MGKRKMTQYAEEFKQSSAKLANESEKPITETAKDLGINKTTLHGWVKKYHPT
jgi:transposase